MIQPRLHLVEDIFVPPARRPLSTNTRFVISLDEETETLVGPIATGG
jgi:hypothetical protein